MEPPNAAFLLLVVGRLVRERVEAALSERGTSLRHLAALGHLKAGPGLSYSELARRAGVTVQSMQATLHQLESSGAVERRSPPGRGRLAQLHLTPAGVAVVASAEEAVDHVSEDLLAALPPDQHQQATRLLLRLFVSLTRDGGAAAPPPDPTASP